MKIAFTSDIHSDITLNNKLLISFLVNRIKEINPDAFVIAGDVSNSLDNLDVTLQQFEELKCVKVMVPGNHDLWIESNTAVSNGRDSLYKYIEAVPWICSQNGFVYPIEKPLIIDDVAVVGSVGWYDYSFADNRLSHIYDASDYENGVFGEGIWNDTRYAIWLKDPSSSIWIDRLKKFTNQETFDIVFNKLKNAVSLIPEGMEKILVVLHTAPFKECIIPRENPYPFDAYEGSAQIGNFISDISKNKDIRIICGHRHKKLFIERSNIKLYRSPIGYLDKSEMDLRKIVYDSVGVFEI